MWNLFIITQKMLGEAPVFIGGLPFL